MTTLWAAVIRGVSLSFLSKRCSAGVRDWHLLRFLCPRTGLLEQNDTSSRRECSQRGRFRHCGLHGLLYGLRCWKIKELLHLFAFLSVRAILQLVSSLYTMFFRHICSLQFTAWFLLCAAHIWVLTGLLLAGTVGWGVFPRSAHLKHIQTMWLSHKHCAPFVSCTSQIYWWLHQPHHLYLEDAWSPWCFH